MNNEQKIIVIDERESVIDSIIKDTVTFGGLFILFWASHEYFGGSWVIDIITLVMSISYALHITKNGTNVFSKKSLKDFVNSDNFENF